MTARIIFVLLISITVLACSDKSNNSSGQTLDISGITHTDINGNINGTTDTTDWRLHNGNPPYKILATLDQTGGIPDSFEVKPAYPNPTDGLVTLTFAFPVAVSYQIRIIDKHKHTLMRYDGTNDPGILTINWASTDSLGNALPADVYRVVYAFNGLWGYGDIMVVR
jgi:hypothetical protein